ncbi:MAG: hypothetical protein ACLUTA_14130 [Blautia wexlerae]
MKKQDEKVTTARVREFLEENTDPGYRKFHSSLLPGVDNIMGCGSPHCVNSARILRKCSGGTGLNRQMTSGMKKPCYGD